MINLSCIYIYINLSCICIYILFTQCQMANFAHRVYLMTHRSNSYFLSFRGVNRCRLLKKDVLKYACLQQVKWTSKGQSQLLYTETWVVFSKVTISASDTEDMKYSNRGWTANTDLISAMASQITGVWIVCQTVCSGADQNKTSKLRVTGLYEGNSPVARWFPSQRASNAENVSIWWRHHGSTLSSFDLL